MNPVLRTALRVAVAVTAIIVLYSVPSSGDESEKVREARSRFLQIRTEQLKASWPKILGQWAAVAVSAVNRERYNLPPSMVEPVKLNEPAQMALRELLERTAIPADGYRAGCFHPTHAIVFRKDDEEFQLLIDFHCDEIATPGVMPKGEWRNALKSFSVEMRGYLNGLLDAATAKRKAATTDTQGPELLHSPSE